jgi:hypothetical protein
MPTDDFATGRCLCGAVSYRIASAPVRMAQCHCRDCQRASGTGHTSQAFFRAGDVSIEGRTASFAVTAESGNTVTRYFCPTCGSRIFNENTGRPGIFAVTVGCLDDSRWFAPEAVIFTRDRPEWDVTSVEIPNFDAMSPIPKPVPAPGDQR